VITSHVRLFMILISHVKIIAFQLSLFCKNYRFSKTVLYIINRKILGCLEIPDLFLVLNMISHSFAALTREMSCMFNTRNKSGISAYPCIILYLKHEQQCFIRYKDTRRRRVSLGLIKQALRMF
jgi:hypothetical protein